MKNGDTFKAQNGEAVITLVPDYNGAVYSFSAYQNGHWSEWSDEIQVRITADGYTTPTDLHLPLAAPTYTTPTDLKVVTTTSGLTMDVNAVEHAENGAIRVVRREDGLTTWTKKLTQMSKAQQVAIPATAFAQPGRYAMYIEVYDTDSFTYNDTLWVITVTGDPTPTPALPKIFLGEKTVAQFGEPLSFEVQASGTISNGFAVFDINGYGYDVPIRSVWVEEEETGKAKTMIRFNNTRLIGRELYVSFKYQIDGVWTEFSEPYLFVIQPEAGEISNPRPELEKNKAAIGEKITVNFQTDERVDHYEVWAWSSAYAAKWYEGGFKTFEVEEPGKASIDTSKLDVGTWYIRVYAYPKAGYINIEDSDVYDILYLTKPSTVALTTLTLPSALTTIEEQAFYGTIAEKVVIPGKCQSIGSQAFAFAPNLTVAVIPASVTSIAEDAFLGCGGLTIQTTGTNTAAYKFATAHGFAVTVGN